MDKKLFLNLIFELLDLRVFGNLIFNLNKIGIKFLDSNTFQTKIIKFGLIPYKTELDFAIFGKLEALIKKYEIEGKFDNGIFNFEMEIDLNQK